MQRGKRGGYAHRHGFVDEASRVHEAALVGYDVPMLAAARTRADVQL
jgi:hypothetical protein